MPSYVGPLVLVLCVFGAFIIAGEIGFFSLSGRVQDVKRSLDRHKAEAGSTLGPLPSPIPGSTGPIGPPGSNAPASSPSNAPTPPPDGCDTYSPGVLCVDGLETNSLVVNELSVHTADFDAVCLNELVHTVSGPLSPDYQKQILQGTGVAPVLPAPVFPVVPLPLSTLPPDESFSSGDVFPLGHGLSLGIQSDNVFSSLDPANGDRSVRLGVPESVWGNSGDGLDNDAAAPFRNEVVQVQFAVDAATLPAGAAGIKIGIKIWYSTEATFDFVLVRGAAIADFDGFGPEISPFLTADINDITLLPGTTLTISFTKDSCCYEGLDVVHIVVKTVTAVAAPLPAPLGPAGLSMTLPANLSPYMCGPIFVCANDANLHTINLTGTGLAFDASGLYTELQFVSGGPCCAELVASASNRLAVIGSGAGCLAYCRASGRACTSHPGVLASTEKRLELSGTATLPSTHGIIRVGGSAPALLIIPCDDIALYVGRHYSVVSNVPYAHKIVLLTGTTVCKTHFQIGDPLVKRVRGNSLIMIGEIGAAVEFTIVSTELISVSTNRHVHVCSGDQCGAIGDVLNPFAGLWIAEQGTEVVTEWGDSIALYFSATSDLAGGNRLDVVTLAGPPAYLRHPVAGYTPGTLFGYDTATVRQAEIVSPFVASFGPPNSCDSTRIHIDPEDPSLMAISYPAVGPCAALIFGQWGNDRNEEFGSYFMYRRTGAPYGVSGNVGQAMLGLGTDREPSLLPFNVPDRIISGQNFQDTRFLFDYFVEMLLTVYHDGAFTRDVEHTKCSGIESQQFARELQQRLHSEAVQLVMPLYRAQRTASSRNLTVLETVGFHTVNPFTDVRVRNVTGPWSVLNDKVFRVTMTTANAVKRHLPGSMDNNEGNPAQRTLHYVFHIDFDSSELPVDDELTNFALIDGVIEVQHGPVRSNMEYKPFMDALVYWQEQVFYEVTHGFVRFPASGLESRDRLCIFAHANWTELQRDITEDPSGIHSSWFAGGRDPDMVEMRRWSRQNDASVSSRYVNAWGHADWFRTPFDLDFEDPNVVACIANTNLFTFGAPELENFPESPRSAFILGEDISTLQDAVDYELNYHIPLRSYLEPDSVRTFSWRMEGAPGADPLGHQVDASEAYAPFDGSKGDYFVAELVPLGELPCPTCSFLSRVFPINGACSEFGSCNEAACLDGLCETRFEFYRDTQPLRYQYWTESAFCGIINRSYTAPHVFGYCYFADATMGDPNNFMTDRFFAQPGTTPPSNPRARREAFSGVLAPMMQHMFSTYNASDIFYDIRGNNGGGVHIQPALAEFHGAYRKRSFQSLFSPRSEGLKPRRNSSENYDPLGLEVLMRPEGHRYMYPEINEANYPGSTKPGANAFLLSDWNSISGGDQFVPFFAGNNSDGELGAGAHAYLFGNPVGTLYGLNGQDGATFPMTPDSYLLRDETTGRPISPVYMSLDRRNTNYAYADRYTPICRRAPFSFPSKMESLPGLNGGNSPPQDDETIWLPDTGRLPNPRPRLPGDTRPQTPTPGVRYQYRDAWLEAGIRQAIQIRESKKRSPHHHQNAETEEYYKRVAQWKALFRNDKRTVDVDHGIPHCGSTTLADTAKLPKKTVATITHHRNVGLPDERKVTHTYNGQVVRDAQALHAQYQDDFQQQIKDGHICVDDEGKVRYTAKATHRLSTEHIHL